MFDSKKNHKSDKQKLEELLLSKELMEDLEEWRSSLECDPLSIESDKSWKKNFFQQAEKKFEPQKIQELHNKFDNLEYFWLETTFKIVYKCIYDGVAQETLPTDPKILKKISLQLAKIYELLEEMNREKPMRKLTANQKDRAEVEKKKLTAAFSNLQIQVRLKSLVCQAEEFLKQEFDEMLMLGYQDNGLQVKYDESHASQKVEGLFLKDLLFDPNWFNNIDAKKETIDRLKTLKEIYLAGSELISILRDQKMEPIARLAQAKVWINKCTEKFVRKEKKLFGKTTDIEKFISDISQTLYENGFILSLPSSAPGLENKK